MPIIDDGTVVPSYMGLRAVGYPASTGYFNNTTLRYGEVKNIIYPDDNRSISKKFVEYTVEIQYKEGAGPGTTTKYLGCLLNNPFGGIADYLKFSLRISPTDKVDKNTGIGIGSKVLLLCVNGEKPKAVIIGGLNDPLDTPDTEDGHQLKFEFNGMNCHIDKDGAFTLTFKGATKADGKPDHTFYTPKAPGSTLKFDKDGNVNLGSKDNKQYVSLDNVNKLLSIGADNNIDIISAKKAVYVTAKENVNVQSSGLLVGDATDNFIKGSTYRTAEATCNNQILAAVTQLNALTSTAATSLQVAATVMKVPIAGAVAASASLNIAATAITSMVAAISQIMSAISTFESQAPQYLSTKNLSD